MNDQQETTIFDSRLNDDEYIIWHGKTASFNNILHPTRFLSLFSQTILHLGCAFSIALVLSTVFFHELGRLGGFTIFIATFIWLATLFWMDINNSYAEKHWDENTQSEAVQRPQTMQFVNPWMRNQYAITNQRVLLYENGRLSETSLILMQDAVKTKPKSGKSDINLYNQRSPTGQLPAPIATLNNLSEDDAEAAYDLLIHARDISFEERIEDLGLD